jgi:energy-coupling factor transporter ATP-binding protein EcfA2
MKIRKIKICNVKGICEHSIEALLLPNRPNILVAPNGFGKSSIATAFASIEPSGMKLSEDDAHNNDVTNLPSLEIELTDGRTVFADSQTNTIKSLFHVCVAHNALKPGATAKHFSGRTLVKTYMDIKPTVLIRTIPQKVDYGYKSANLKKSFGTSSKVLPNILKVYSNIHALEQIEEKGGVDFHEFELQRYNNPISAVRERINALFQLTASAIIRKIEDEQMFGGISSNLDKLKEILKETLQLGTNAEAYLAAWQYIEHRKTLGNINNRKALQYAKFLHKKAYIDKTLDNINPVKERFNISSSIEGRTLLIRWPRANLMSGGQRDSMVFISQLMECEFHHEGNCLLVIDEFFDYLDDANIVAFQYYISTMIANFKTAGRLIFPVLLTHLDPNYLKHFCFNESRLNVIYLQETKARITKPMRDLVASREKEELKDILDQYYFHHSEGLFDQLDFLNEFQRNGLNVDWAKPSVFHKKIHRQLRAYLLDDKVYDPIAVCLSVRLRIEEILYNQIREDKRIELIGIHGTTGKLQFALKNGVCFPETYFLLGIVYNHPLHEISENMDKPLGMKLDNSTIKNMIMQLWSVQ